MPEERPSARDLTGYGADPPEAGWPGGARVAVQFVLNVEAGGERTVLNGDAGSETYLHEVPGTAQVLGGRSLSSESMFEYGARAGCWRILRLFAERRLPLTAFVVGRALELNPELGAALAEAGHELACHGYRWIDYREVPESVEREHLARTVALIEQATGRPPVGAYTGRTSPNTRRLLVEHGGFLYDADSYADDLPYWVTVGERAHLVVPYALDTNDMKFAVSTGFGSATGFYEYLVGAFELLLREGRTRPRMMSVGLHGRLSGRPGRAAALERFLDHVAGREDVWICRREQIARHWIARHPFDQGAVDLRTPCPD